LISRTAQLLCLKYLASLKALAHIRTLNSLSSFCFFVDVLVILGAREN
jgi:hypothetical protein